MTAGRGAWASRSNEEALLHYATGLGIEAKALSLIGYEDEE